MKVKNRKTGEVYSAYADAADIGFNGRYTLRWLVGIENYQGFNLIHAIYDNDEFNSKYEVIEYNNKRPGWMASD